MIKSNELRIGNWVKYGGKPYQVTFIEPDDGLAENNYYNPIPLTPEILEKAGFVKDEDGVYVKHKCLYVVEDVLQIAIRYAPLFNCPCKYVHQLQNLIFAITGKELNIQL